LYLVRSLGEGGKGVVNLEQQEAPVRRRVALNPIRHNWRRFGGAVRWRWRGAVLEKRLRLPWRAAEYDLASQRVCTGSALDHSESAPGQT
jgi:hypothetical protein